VKAEVVKREEVGLRLDEFRFLFRRRVGLMRVGGRERERAS
jgi:hypothetical protein